MEPDWIRRPLHEMELTHRPLTRSLLVLQLVQRPLARQVPPPRSGWPQFRGQAALVGAGGGGSEVAGASVGLVGGSVGGLVGGLVGGVVGGRVGGRVVGA